MSVKALRNQLLAAIAMVLVAAIALGSSTFAWFAANQTVQVKGMSVNTRVSDNLMISYANTEATYATKLLNQNRQALLEPASTIDGVNYFYHDTLHIAGTGAITGENYIAYYENATDAIANDAAGKTNYDPAFQNNYSINLGSPVVIANAAYGYIDYVFYLKATNSQTTGNQSVLLTKLNLLRQVSGVDTQVDEKAWRVAVFSQKLNEGATSNTVGNLISILSLSGAENFEAGKAVKAETVATALDTVTKAGESVVIANDLAPTSTQRYKVVVRLWLEGEDKTCNNQTFANLTSDNWTLEMQIDLSSVSGATAVNAISSDTSWHVDSTAPVVNDPNDGTNP